MQQLSKGTTLQGGKYIIERVLGQGGFGITYLATDFRTGKSIAIKEFFPKDYCTRDIVTGYISMHRPEMEKYKQKFISEANKIARLKHKGIIKVVGVFEENGTAYYSMEYIAGQSLFEILKQRRFSLEESIKIIEKISKALAHIHSKRMLHLDIKPMNIMIRSSDNEPIIIDFGISKTYDTHGNPNTTFLPAASPGYSPAEQFEGKVNHFAPQLDIYSLGATFYSLITGEIPLYPTPNTAKNLVFSSSTPKYVIDAIKKAMAYKQTDRFATVQEFLTALQLTPTKTNRGQKPLILTFSLKPEAPYYVGDEIELSWSIRNCDSVYLNGKLQQGLRKSKTIKYSKSGKKRFTIKAVNGSEEISRTIDFEVLPKVPIKDAENTNVIVADIVADEKPVINFFKRSGTDKIYVGDEVSVYWQVKGADTITVNGVQVPKTSNKKLIKVTSAGDLSVILIATNSSGSVRESINLTVFQNTMPQILLFEATKNNNVKIEESITLLWSVVNCSQVRLGRDKIVPAKGSKLISFQHGGSYAYTLHATNDNGSVSKTVNIIVNGEPHPNGYSQKNSDKSYDHSIQEFENPLIINGVEYIFHRNGSYTTHGSDGGETLAQIIFGLIIFVGIICSFIFGISFSDYHSYIAGSILFAVAGLVYIIVKAIARSSQKSAVEHWKSQNPHDPRSKHL